MNIMTPPVTSITSTTNITPMNMTPMNDIIKSTNKSINKIITSKTMTIHSPPIPIITFITAWYDLGSKFAKEQYYIWAENLLKNVRKFNLIVYVDNNEVKTLINKLSNNNPLIYVIILPFDELFLMKQYSTLFEENHKYNKELNRLISWKLLILWCSKQYFVEMSENEIINKNKKYPTQITKYYGWIDIGYFRNTSNHNKINNGGHLSEEEIQQFPDLNKIKKLNVDKIHYALVYPENIKILKQFVYNRNDYGLPNIPLPLNQLSIAGGFFILGGGGPSKIWREQFETHLLKYLQNNYIVKDDQYIIIDLIILNPKIFELWVEPQNKYFDSWFLFQRLLL